MPREVDRMAEAFVQWAKTAKDEELRELAEYLEDELYALESDDFFGTEGINKRFA